MAFLFDLLLLAIVVGTILTCMRKGFVRSVIELAGGIFAAIAAYFLAQPVGAWLSGTFVKPFFEDKIAASLLSVAGTEATGNAAEAILNFDLTKVLSDAPQALQELLARYNIDLAYTQSVAAAESTVADKSAAVVDAIATPVANTISLCVSFLVLFVLFMMVIGLLARLASKISYIPVVGKVNRILGTVFGACKAVVLVFVVAALLRFVVPYLAEPMHLDRENPYQNTLIFKYVDQINPISKLLPDSF